MVWTERAGIGGNKKLLTKKPRRCRKAKEGVQRKKEENGGGWTPSTEKLVRFRLSRVAMRERNFLCLFFKKVCKRKREQL